MMAPDPDGSPIRALSSVDLFGTPMFMHPFLEGTFTREHAAEKIPYVRFRHSASIEPLLSRGGSMER